MKSLSVFFFLVILLISFSDNAKAQNCPADSTSNCGPWLSATYTNTTNYPDCQLSVTFRYRICGSEYQIYIDTVRKSGNCEYLDDVTNSTTFMDWLNIVLIEETLKLQGAPTPTDCPNTILRTTFQSASCGIWVKCVYTISPAQRVCDADWRGTFPDYDEGGIRKIKYWKWQSCGSSCCKKVYSICNQFDPYSGGYSIKITGVHKERTAPCSNPENVLGTCIDGCE